MRIYLKMYNTIFLFLMLIASISCNSVIVRFPILNDVELKQLHICKREITQDASEEEKQQDCSNTYSSDIAELYLCGEVSGIGDVDAFLGIYLHKDGVEGLIFHNTIDDRFTNGFFCRTIPLPEKDDRGGIYSIELRHNRHVLDTIDFEIR